MMTQWMTLPAVMGPSGFLLSIIMVAVCHKTQHQIKSREKKDEGKGFKQSLLKKRMQCF